MWWWPAADGEPPLNQKSRWDDWQPRGELTPLPSAVEADFACRQPQIG
jgi:hypothetical protein